MCAPEYFTLYDAALVGPGYMFAAAAIYYSLQSILRSIGFEELDTVAFCGSLVAATLIVWVLANGSRLDGDYKSPTDPPRNQTF